MSRIWPWLVGFTLTCLSTVRAVEYAWWVTFTFPPTQTVIESIPIKTIDKQWDKASLLTKTDIPHSGVKDLLGNQSFSLAGDFNRDGKNDKAMVGVYKDSAGKAGKFILILTETKPGKWAKAFVAKSGNSPGFSVLRMEGKDVSWEQCLSCGGIAYVVYENGAYQLDWGESE